MLFFKIIALPIVNFLLIDATRRREEQKDEEDLPFFTDDTRKYSVFAHTNIDLNIKLLELNIRKEEFYRSCQLQLNTCLLHSWHLVYWQLYT